MAKCSDRDAFAYLQPYKFIIYNIYKQIYLNKV